MSRSEPPTTADTHTTRGSRVRAYLRRFFTCWVTDDPQPTYSALDRADGVDQSPDPVTTPRRQRPESSEVYAYEAHEAREEQASGRPLS